MKSSENPPEESRTDWQRLRAMTDDEIDLSDLPEATAEEMSRGRLRLAGRPLDTIRSERHHDLDT